MHVTEHLKHRAGKTLFSVEVVPPDKGKVQGILSAVETLVAYRPAFISVTAHPDLVYVETGDHGPTVRTTRRGLNTHAICWTLSQKYDIEVVPHVICIGFTKKETEDALIDLHAFGIDNVLALRGDLAFPQGYTTRPTEYHYAIELVRQIADMNRGVFLEGPLPDEHTNFCMGIAGYPEGHPQSPNPSKEIDYLKEKIDAGASYVLCNMFFDNTHYFRYQEALAAAGITVPVLPALKPVFTPKQIETISQRFQVSIPPALRDAILSYEQPIDRKRAGIEHIVKQATDLMDEHVPCIHFYSMGRANTLDDVFAILQGREAAKKYGLL
jgi:methylenetetrahydrofolate reductase (NADPH)